MKIRDLKIIVVGNPWKNWAFIRLDTDEGITGYGECTGGLSRCRMSLRRRSFAAA